jgi:hypothetical protein
MHLDFAGGTPQAWLRNQQQDAQPLNEYVALMSAVTSKLPKQMMADQDVRKSLVNSFIPEVRDLMLRRNAYWVTDRQGGYPSPEEIYRAAYEVSDFQKALDANPYSAPDIDQAMYPQYPRINSRTSVQHDRVNSPPQSQQILALVNDPNTPLYMPFEIDHDMLNDVMPGSNTCQPDPNAVFTHQYDRPMQEEYFCGLIRDVNKLDITTSSDLQICLRKISQWFGELAQNTWFASQFKTAAKQAIQNVRTGIDRNTQNKCWNCGESGHLKANCPQPRKRLTDHR